MKLRSSGAVQTGSRSQAVSKILACQNETASVWRKQWGTLKLGGSGAVQKGQASSLRRLAQEECHGDKEPVEQEGLLHAWVQAGARQSRLNCIDIHPAALCNHMIVCAFISDCYTWWTLVTDVFDQVTDNPGTSVQPSWLAEDVKILSLCHLRVRQFRA